MAERRTTGREFDRHVPGRLYFACCSWWLVYEGWPPPESNGGLLTCPRCGHWLMFHMGSAAFGPSVGVLRQAVIEQIAADRPELARELTIETAIHVRRKPCCHAAWGDA
jgi:hypothetical protein